MSKPTLFFSHSSKDKDMVLTIKNKVMQYTSGTLEIFQSSDGESIPFGTNWIHKVEEGLREASKTGEIDEWCIQFLPILFEGKSIKQFNTAMYLEALKEKQTHEYFRVVEIRWQAIQSYFMGNIEKCVEHLEAALKLAEEMQQPAWVVKDILIDLRNQQMELGEMKNQVSIPEAQQQLSNSEEELYYPLIDRINGTLHEKLVDGFYKEKTASPYTVTYGSNIDTYGNLLASSFVTAMYNGSLTHLLLTFEKIKRVVFYLSSKYSNWNFKRVLLQLTIFARNEKEIDKLQKSYPELLNHMTADDASIIMDFCSNHPIKHKKFISQLLGLGAVGYYLSDADFKKYEVVIAEGVREFVSSDVHIIMVGANIFKGLRGVAYRMSQEILAEFCILFMENHFRRWYSDVFRFIEDCVDLRKMQEEAGQSLVSHIINLLEDERDREEIKLSPAFLYILTLNEQIQKIDKAPL